MEVAGAPIWSQQFDQKLKEVSQRFSQQMEESRKRIVDNLQRNLEKKFAEAFSRIRGELSLIREELKEEESAHSGEKQSATTDLPSGGGPSEIVGELGGGNFGRVGGFHRDFERDENNTKPIVEEIAQNDILQLDPELMERSMEFLQANFEKRKNDRSGSGSLSHLLSGGSSTNTSGGRGAAFSYWRGGGANIVKGGSGASGSGGGPGFTAAGATNNKGERLKKGESNDILCCAMGNRDRCGVGDEVLEKGIEKQISCHGNVLKKKKMIMEAVVRLRSDLEKKTVEDD